MPIKFKHKIYIKPGYNLVEIDLDNAVILRKERKLKLEKLKCS